MLFADIQRTSFVDYPGKIVSTLFTQGCNFRCHYCHNSELVEPGEGKITEEEILTLLEERKKLIDGVCITGGEPLLNDIEGFLRKVKEKGFLIKIDTNGTNIPLLKRLISQKLVDYAAMDIKAPFERYSEVVQKNPNIEKIKECALILIDSGIEYEFRTTVVRDLLTKEDIKTIGKQLFGLGKKKPKRYFLQQFVSQDKLVDPYFIDKVPFDPDDFREMKESVKKYFEEVGTRGV